MTTKIYLYCVPYHFLRDGDVLGFAVAEDGRGLASHLSSGVDFSKHDMGLTSDWKHVHYTREYPDGYELEWVDDVDNHAGLQGALQLNAERHNHDTPTPQPVQEAEPA